jgi:hypothetical protein
MLENRLSIDEVDVIDLTGDADSSSGQAADTESTCMYSNLAIRTREPVEEPTDLPVLATGLGRGKRPPDFIHHATTGGLRLPSSSTDSVETLTSPFGRASPSKS